MIKAVVTGHSRGLGAAIAAALLSRQIPVLGIARNGNAALALRHADHLQQIRLDLADPEALSRWCDSLALTHFLSGCQTVLLINNAGSLQPMGPLHLQDSRAIVRSCALNVTAPQLLSAALARHLPPACTLRILHVSSGAGRHPYPGWSVYCASKAALDHHARAVALDADERVRISALAPGVIDTDMQAEIRNTTVEHFPLRERFEALHRHGELVAPEAAAERLVAHLLGDSFGRQPVVDLRELPA